VYLGLAAADDAAGTRLRLDRAQHGGRVDRLATRPDSRTHPATGQLHGHLYRVRPAERGGHCGQ
jgi:hypothetical protein